MALAPAKRNDGYTAAGSPELGFVSAPLHGDVPSNRNDVHENPKDTKVRRNSEVIWFNPATPLLARQPAR